MKKKLKLTNEELAEIKGLGGIPAAGDDIKNDNTVSGCVCYYNNTSLTTNSNGVSICTCECI